MAASKVPLFVLWVSVMFVLAAFDGAKAQEGYDVFATYNPDNPDPESMEWDMAGMFCARWDANKPLPWRQHYGWTAFCAPDGEHGEAPDGEHGKGLCGRCLKVMNRATGASTVVRVVDQCNNDMLVLDVAVFMEIDTDESGIKNDYLKVDYRFVDCKDD